MAWLETFSASLQDASRAHMLQLVERDYPDTHQLAAACVCSDSGVVAVADEFWEALPLGHMSDEEFRTIEREIVALYALNLKDGREHHGALAMAMDAAQPTKPAMEPSPVAKPPAAKNERGQHSLSPFACGAAARYYTASFLWAEQGFRDTPFAWVYEVAGQAAAPPTPETIT